MEVTFCAVEAPAGPGEAPPAETTATLLAALRSAAGPGDKVVKIVGGSGLLACPTPASALALTQRLLEGAAATPCLQPLRIGLHQGDAVRRGEDWFGSAINVAFRVAGAASPGQILATEAVAAHVEDAGFSSEQLGTFELRNVLAPLRLFALLPVKPAPEQERDPVCDKPIRRDEAVGRLHYFGKNYWFCSFACAGAFAAAPEGFAAPKP